MPAPTSTRFQAFRWADYAAKPGYHYRYRVIPMYGAPGALVEKAATDVIIDTDPLRGRVRNSHGHVGLIASALQRMISPDRDLSPPARKPEQRAEARWPREGA